MKIFISWSGRESEHVAKQLDHWLPKVIQGLEPWFSKKDILAGTRWRDDLAGRLEETKFGIICATAQSQKSPWVLFEAGALSKSVGDAYVCPYLVGIEESSLVAPLAQYQSKKADEHGTFGLLEAVNTAAGKPLAPETLRETFALWWPQLEAAMKKQPPKRGKNKPRRSVESLLEENYQMTKAIARLMLSHKQPSLTLLDPEKCDHCDLSKLKRRMYDWLQALPERDQEFLIKMLEDLPPQEQLLMAEKIATLPEAGSLIIEAMRNYYSKAR